MMVTAFDKPLPKNGTAARHGIPIVFGVTGHRDIPLDDVSILHTAVRDYLRQEVIAKYPNTRVMFLSALAEGADRLAARAALEAGCQLGVFLPFAQDEYLKDFDSEASKKEFLDFVAQAEFVEVAQRLPDSDPASRDQGYVAVGVTIARYAQCLLALWDGIGINKPGGTADVVRIYRTGIPMPRPMPDDIISALECGPVQHFLTRRSSNLAAIPAGKIGSRQFLPPMPSERVTDASGLEEQERRRWDRIFDCIDRFNLDAKSLPEHIDVPAYTQGYLISESQVAAQWSEADGKAQRIARLFASADALSMKAQAERWRHFYQIIALTLMAVFFEQLYSGPFALPVLLAISIVWAGFATWQYRRVGKKKLEEKYLDYRTLAEATRVQFFWRVAGLRDCPADHYLRDQRDELEWLRQAVRALDLPSKVSAPATNPALGIQIAVTAWVKDQSIYFLNSATKQAAKADKFSRQSGRWFFAAICMVMFAVIFHAASNAWFPDINELIIPSLPVFYGLLFAGSGVIKLYENIMAYQEQANRYRKMAAHFGLCNQRLEQALAIGDLAAAQSLLLMIGRQALMENAEWLLLHRQRPIEMPL